MTKFVMFGDVVEANGKTVRENNLAIGHNIPVGSLVEINLPEYPDVHGLRLWVVEHSRDCDGEPLYVLSFALEDKEPHDGEDETATLIRRFRTTGGWPERSLVVIR